MKDLTIGGFVMNEIDKIQEQIDEHRKEIRRLNEIIQTEKTKDFYDKIELNEKFYRFTYDYIDYYGIITNFRYIESDDEYVMSLCGFGGEFLDVADGNWFTYDAAHFFYIKPNDLYKFIKTFIEISREEFDNRLKCALDAVAADLDEWIDVYQQNDRTLISE